MNLAIKNILFSIIIPVYNVEKYLNQCIDSILCQTFSDYELILVNDGSTDGSLEICSEYKNRDERIQLFDKENGGAADSRNYGLSKATGKYVIFVDGDDFWVGDFVLNEMALLISNKDFDIIIHEESRYFSNNNIKYKYYRNKLKHKSGNFEADILDLIFYHLYASSPWDKIIKRSILIDNNLFFPLNRKCEDMEWCAKLMCHINTYCIYPKSFYMYRQLRAGSEVYSINENAVLDIYKSVKKGLVATDGNKTALQLATKNYWSFYYVVLLMYYCKLGSENKKAIINDLYLWKHLISPDRNLTVNKVVFFYRLIPFFMLPYFLDCYAKVNFLYKKSKV